MFRRFLAIASELNATTLRFGNRETYSHLLRPAVITTKKKTRTCNLLYFRNIRTFIPSQCILSTAAVQAEGPCFLFYRLPAGVPTFCEIDIRIFRSIEFVVYGNARTLEPWVEEYNITYDFVCNYTGFHPKTI